MFNPLLVCWNIPNSIERFPTWNTLFNPLNLPALCNRVSKTIHQISIFFWRCCNAASRLLSDKHEPDAAHYQCWSLWKPSLSENPEGGYMISPQVVFDVADKYGFVGLTALVLIFFLSFLKSKSKKLTPFKVSLAIGYLNVSISVKPKPDR